MGKRTFSILLALAMAFSLLPANALAADIEATEPYAWGGGDDISEPAQVDGVYQISSGSELAWLAQEVNARRGNSYSAAITRDIDLGGEEWTPIGQTYTTRYAGTFDGGGHTVTGLAIHGSSSGNYGLFGYVEGGSVKDLTVEGEIVLTGSGSSSYGSAGIVGCFSGTTGAIENCVNKASVTGQQNVGGVVGIISDGYSSNDKAVRSCANLGDVRSNGNKAGGVVGYVKGAVTVEDCYDRGAVTGGGWYSGGITAYTDSSYATVRNCYTTGSVSGSGAAAAIGRKSSGSVSGLYYLDALAEDKNATAKTDAEMRSADLAAALGDAFLPDSGGLNDGYPILGFQVAKYPVTFTVSPAAAQVAIPGASGDHTDGAWSFQLPAGAYTYTVSLFGYVAQSGTFTVTDGAVTETITLGEAEKRELVFAVSPKNANATVTVTWNGETVAPERDTTYALPYGDYHYLVTARGYTKAEADFSVDAGSAETVSIALEPSTAWDGESRERPGGEGTQASPYQIGTGEELAWLADQVNTAGGSIFAALTDDIDLNGAAWTPIGNGYSAKFQGGFDGQGHTVSGLNVSGQEYAGLFGHADSATIQNTVVRGRVAGTSYAGGVLGRADLGVALLNCGNEAEVSTSGTSGAGGIVGRVHIYGDGSSSVSGCYNSGAVSYTGSGYGYAGGIAGYDNGQTPISHCYNTGAVTSGRYAGGIRGYGSSTAGTISNCYNVGAVAGASAGDQGGIAPGGYSHVSGCYYLDTGSDGNDGSAARSAAELRSADFVGLLGVDWKRDDRTNGGLPILFWQPVAPMEETDHPALMDAAFDWIPYEDETEEWQNSGEILPTLRWSPAEGVSAYDIILWSEYFAVGDNANDPEDPYEIRVEKAETLTAVTGTPEDGKLVYDLTETFAALPERRYYATVSAAGSAAPTLAYVKDNIAGYATPYDRLKPVTGLHWEGTRACWDAKLLTDIQWAFDADDYYVLTLYRRDENGAFVAGTSTSIPGGYNKVDCSGYFAVGGTYAFTVAAGTGEKKAGFGFADSLESLRSDDPSNGGEENGVYTVAAADVPGGEHGADWVAITSAEEWMELANVEDIYEDPDDPTTSLQARAWGKKYYLTDDLDLSTLPADQEARTKSIGNVTHRFMGVMDGNGHKITGLTLSGYDPGLFRYVGSTGYICDLTVEGANILASDNAAVLAHSNFGTIANCAVVNSNITADTGAVIGGMVSRNYGAIRDSYVEGGVLLSSSATATGHAGFVGANEEGALIERCWTSMEVKTQSDHAGGFVGLGYGGTIRNCFALGDVSARGYSGGFAGRSVYGGNVYENCYAAGVVTVTGEEGRGFIGVSKPDSAFQVDPKEEIANCWYNAASPADVNATGGKTIEEMAAPDFASRLDRGEAIWIQDGEQNDGLPYLKGIKAPQRPETAAITVTVAIAGYDKDAYTFSQLGGDISVTLDGSQNTRVVDVMDAAQAQGLLTYSYDTTPAFGRYIHTINGRAVEMPDGWMFTVNDTLSNVSASLATLQDGDRLLWFEGTTENRFQPPTWAELKDSALEWTDISTVSALMALANSGDAAALAKNYRLSADLDLTGVSFPGIGSAAAPFTGIFDGDGHTVSNVTIQGTEDVGFFGAIKGATVKELTLTGLQVSGQKRVGGLVGWAQVELNVQSMVDSAASLIGSCTVSGSLSGRDTAGGLVGLNDGAYDEKTGFSIASAVDKCVADVAVTGTEEGSVVDRAAIGGLVGQNDGTITKCAATGAVTAPESDLVGGLVGSNGGDIYESHADGDVTGRGSTGGFLGSSSGTVKNSYSLGNVAGTDSNVGGFAGAIGAVENAMSAGRVFGGAGFAGTLSGQVTGVASQVTAKNIYANCVGDPALSPVGNTFHFTSERQKEILAQMALTTRAAVAEKLYEMFGVVLPAPEALRAEADKYADAVTVAADAKVGDAISLLKPGMTADASIAVTVETDSPYLSGGGSLTLAVANAGAAQTVSVRVKLSDGTDALYHTVTVTLPSGLETAELIDAIAQTLTESADGWTVLDMALYQTLPGKTAQTTAEARQQALDQMIAEAAGGTATVSDRARLELVLRSIGVDSASLYPASSNKAVSNAEKLAGADLSSGGYYAAPWILLAELQGNVKLSDAQRQGLIALLQDNVGDGLFGYEWGGSTHDDPDTAGAALAALAPYYGSDAGAKAVVDTILAALPQGMAENGSFGNANADAMVIIGLVALGKDPGDLKAGSGACVVDGLLSYVNAGGNGFLYDGSDNALATEQGFRALIALAKFDGSTPCNIYDFSAVETAPGRATGSGQPSRPGEPGGEGTIYVTLTLKADPETWIAGDRLRLQAGSTVYHALRQALQDNQMSAAGLENGYVKSITKGDTTLAELDRGPNSGWLYQVNGKASTVPLTSYALHNNDSILWYYTADWTKDPAGGATVGGQTASGSDPSPEDAGQKSVKMSAKEIGAAAAGGGSTRLELTYADVVLPNAALKDLGGRGAKEVTVTAAVTKRGTAIWVRVDGAVLDQVDGGLLVSLPVSAPTPSTVMVRVNEDGTETVLRRSAVHANAVTAPIPGSCTVKAVDNVKTFDDVDSGAWYADAVAFSSGRELLQGVGAAAFDPDGPMTRGMLVTVLHRLEDTPRAAAGELFRDVAPESWSSDAIRWADGLGIVNGYGDGTFGPADPITREQLASILYRYAKAEGGRGELSAFPDAGSVSPWASDAVTWAVENEILRGKGGSLDPQGQATRAEAATMLMRFLENEK